MAALWPPGEPEDSTSCVDVPASLHGRDLNWAGDQVGLRTRGARNANLRERETLPRARCLGPGANQSSLASGT